MTGETRQVLRALVDRRTRDKLAQEYPDRRSCPGCYGDMESWTIGCASCSSRHGRRRRRAVERGELAAPVAKVAGVCVCGCAHSERTAGCETCRQRYKSRARRRLEVQMCRERKSKEAVATSLRESATASNRERVPA